MSISKGSINRVNNIKKANTKVEDSSLDSQSSEVKIEPVVKTEPAIKIETKTATEPAKKPNSIHEEKFKIISKIKQDIPDYLL